MPPKRRGGATKGAGGKKSKVGDSAATKAAPKAAGRGRRGKKAVEPEEIEEPEDAMKKVVAALKSEKKTKKVFRVDELCPLNGAEVGTLINVLSFK